MLIKKITLRNFRNFIDSSIAFSCDKEKNVTIVLGQNTYGKTTLVKAFIWCLYRVNLFKDKILLNKNLANILPPGQQADAKVELELEHKDVTYKISTKETYTKTFSGQVKNITEAATNVIKVKKNGETEAVPSSKVEEEINSILRPELKEYFFFDGETNTIDSVSSKTNITAAVSNLLGLKKIEKIRDFYDEGKRDSVISVLRSELKTDDLTGAQLSIDLEKAMHDKETLDTNIAETEDEIAKLNVQISEKNEKLDANMDILQDQTKKNNLGRDIADGKLRKEREFNTLIAALSSSNSFLKVLFAASFQKYHLEKLREESHFNSDTSYKGISEEAVNELIKAGRCLCGAVIKNGSDAYNHLIEAKNHMEPHDYGKYISDFVDAEQSNLNLSRVTMENIVKTAADVNDLIETIDNYKENYKSIVERIAGREDVGAIQRDISTYNQQLGSKQTLLDNYKAALGSVEQKIIILQKRIEASSEKNAANAFISKCIDYARSIYHLAEQRLSSKKSEIKEQLEAEVGKVFKQMYHGNRKIVIDDKYNAIAVVAEENKDTRLDKSTGLGTVVNYSFVAGLMKLAKSKLANDEEIDDGEVTSDEYPLVMDAPFSNTDDEHIRNICRILPNYCDQIIMFIMKKDYAYAEKAIGDKVGKKYEIHKLEESKAEVTEVTGVNS